MRALGLLLALAVGGCEGRAVTTPVRVASLPSCPDSTVAEGGQCLDPLVAYAAPGARTFVVDGASPRADDAGPGTADRPWRTIGRAARRGALAPGDAVVIREGTYRESVRPRVGGTGPDARVTYAAWPGERVVVTGADPLSGGWRQTAAGAWRHVWEGDPLPASGGLPFRRELVVAGGAVLRPVDSRQALRPGTVWVEGPPDAPLALVARFPDDARPAEVGLVEVGRRAYLFRPTGDDAHPECGAPGTPGWLRVVGITFRHAANRAQRGAVCAGREGALVEDVTVEWTASRGIDVSGTGHRFVRVRADHNGQLGWGGACVGCTITDGAAVGNNWKGHDPFWEAGGAKWVRTRDTVVRRFLAVDNEGPGIWLDADNADNTIEGALVVGNAVAGIMLELRTVRTLVQHNVVAATRWRSWSGTGILSQAASDNVLLHNTVVANEGAGVWLRRDPERRAPDARTTLVDNWIVGNVQRAREAREVQIEGETVALARSHRLDGNVYGRVGGDRTWTSTFFLHPTPAGSYRGNDLGAWRRWTGQDAGSRLVGTDGDPVPASGAAVRQGGAARAPAVRGRLVGAERRRVRDAGEWRTTLETLSP